MGDKLTLIDALGRLNDSGNNMLLTTRRNGDLCRIRKMKSGGLITECRTQDHWSPQDVDLTSLSEYHWEIVCNSKFKVGDLAKITAIGAYEVVREIMPDGRHYLGKKGNVDAWSENALQLILTAEELMEKVRRRET